MTKIEAYKNLYDLIKTNSYTEITPQEKGICITNFYEIKNSICTIEPKYINTFIKKLYSIYKFCKKTDPIGRDISIFNALQKKEKLSYKWIKSSSFLENIFHENKLYFYVLYRYLLKTYVVDIELNETTIATIYLNDIPKIITALKTIYANHSLY